MTQMERGKWRAVPDRSEVRIANPVREGPEYICEAQIDLTVLVPTVPRAIYEALDLPGWGSIDFEGQSTAMNLNPSDDAVVHITLGLLTALNLEINRATGELRSFIPLLHFPVVEVEEMDGSNFLRT